MQSTGVADLEGVGELGLWEKMSSGVLTTDPLSLETTLCGPEAKNSQKGDGSDATANEPRLVIVLGDCGANRVFNEL